MTTEKLLEIIEHARKESLSKLDLSGMGIMELPSEIGSLKKLKLLDVSENTLLELPSEIGELSSLTELWVSDNQLIALPRELTKLSNLEVLTLYGNPLGLPRSILIADGASILAYLQDNVFGCPAKIQIAFKDSKWGLFFPLEQTLNKVAGLQPRIDTSPSRITISLESVESVKTTFFVVALSLAALESVSPNETRMVTVVQSGTLSATIDDYILSDLLVNIHKYFDTEANDMLERKQQAILERAYLRCISDILKLFGWRKMPFDPDFMGKRYLMFKQFFMSAKRLIT